MRTFLVSPHYYPFPNDAYQKCLSRPNQWSSFSQNQKVSSKNPFEYKLSDLLGSEAHKRPLLPQGVHHHEYTRRSTNTIIRRDSQNLNMPNTLSPNHKTGLNKVHSWTVVSHKYGNNISQYDLWKYWKIKSYLKKPQILFYFKLEFYQFKFWIFSGVTMLKTKLYWTCQINIGATRVLKQK